jgi:hypothetical protein
MKCILCSKYNQFILYIMVILHYLKEVEFRVKIKNIQTQEKTSPYLQQAQ